MRKVITMLMMGLMLGSLTAQQEIPIEDSKNIIGLERFENSTTREDQITAWYNYGRSVSAMFENSDYFRNYLFPDSTVLARFGDGDGGTLMAPVWKHGFGQVMDPYTEMWESMERRERMKTVEWGKMRGGERRERMRGATERGEREGWEGDDGGGGRG